MGFASAETDFSFASPPPEEIPALLSDPREEDGTLSASAYLRVTSPTESGWLPLPGEGQRVYRLLQSLSDGSEAENRILLTPEGVRMEYSNCSSQDCLGQGEITLESRDERLLYNMIICLPHQLILELFSREEVSKMIPE